ncbi:family 43 glycosylhydrolase [Microbacterium sp. DT81.1]|uniref:glycoside hydrolase family 43 protein n=1 Tax=Microbacterium sp. DT81.1 TaxID=3393413 RepID=UPI003CE6BB71
MNLRHDDEPHYQNPILDEDRPDPDAIRVGRDFYLVASSFNRAPGLPVFTSRDLVNWAPVTSAIPRNEPEDWFRLPRHGGGVWAPSIRHHEGTFHIVFPDPDRGILVTSATDAAGPWTEPRVLLEGLGLIDPCPLWDDDGAAYLVHGWAGSRAGRKNELWVAPVDARLTTALGPSRLVIDGNALDGYRTLEGPKFYKRDGWYWIFAPAGGVATGWQSVFRSRSVFGPYEGRIALEQGETTVNGPHQGAWVDAGDGTDWFLHFQDRGAFGRVLHLQPMAWDAEGWPLMGRAVSGGAAVPVLRHPSPLGAVQQRRTLAADDDFIDGIDANWAWQANPRADWWDTGSDGLRLVAVPNDGGNLRAIPQVLGQPLPGMPTSAEVSIRVDGPPGTRAGLLVLGRSYLWVGLRVGDGGRRLVVATRIDGRLEEEIVRDRPWASDEVRLRVIVDSDAVVSALVLDGGVWQELAVAFTAVAGHWIGAEIGIFAAAPLGGEPGVARMQRFRIRTEDPVGAQDPIDTEEPDGAQAPVSRSRA